MKSLDRAALRHGASVALVFAVPFSIASRVVSDRHPKSPLVSLLWLLALLGFALGAGVAAWTQTTRLPFLHGMVAAGGTYLAAQAVFVVIRLARGSVPHDGAGSLGRDTDRLHRSGGGQGCVCDLQDIGDHRLRVELDQAGER